MSLKRRKPRSPHGQLNRMAMRWPDLAARVLSDGPSIVWRGPLRGFQMEYQVLVHWSWQANPNTPHVFVLDPQIRPRPGGRFEDIPHLNFDSANPVDSALCLFDPDDGEWNSKMLIADTTVPWASEWLHHYELWHLDGVWRGPNAPGPISVGEMRQADELTGA